jgi:ParB family chromosome partitioning protein
VTEERRLGRGLGSLLSPSIQTSTQGQSGEILYLHPNEVRPNPYQPRDEISDESVAELAESIRVNGLLQPVVVRKAPDGFELVSGERRLRASVAAGLPLIPALQRQADDSQMLTLALIENLQRTDLNPIEKAKAFKRLMDAFNLTQEVVAQRVGMDRSTIANIMRLLDLPDPVKQDVSRGTISMGHARALLSLSDSAAQIQLANRIKKHNLSVRYVERLIAARRDPTSKQAKPAHILDLENRLRQRIGGKVEVHEQSGAGKITIYFADLDDLDRILEVIGA